MLRAKLGRLDERRATAWLAVFFLALAVPSVLLLGQAYDQLKWQAFRQTQQLAEAFAARIDADLRRAIAAEESRSFGDYSFLVVAGDAAANFVQRSPLAAFPVEGTVPGTIGYFQVGSAGELTTPLLPDAGVDAETYGVNAEERRARAAVEETIRTVLADNRLVPRTNGTAVAEDAAPDGADAAAVDIERPQYRSAAPRAAVGGASRAIQSAGSSSRAGSVAPADAQSAFDQLAAGATGGDALRSAAPSENARRVAELDLAAPFAERTAGGVAAQASVAPAAAERQKRTEQAVVAEAAPPAAANDAATADAAEVRVRTFESELDPFALGLLDTGQFVLFRNVWRDGQRYIQGALIDVERFLAAAIESAYRASNVAGGTDLTVAYRGDVLASLRAGAAPQTDLAGSLLYRTRLSPPYGDLELVFSVGRLPRAAGSALLAWLAVALAAVLGGGFVLARRFAVGQIRLTRQQQDFVSAVSHELKTPLTSIRMYGEMLQAGWADESRKRVYYDYIAGESERLSRLIDNVLALARLTRRQGPRLAPKQMSVAELLDLARSKVATQVEHAGFELDVRDETPNGAAVVVDPDGFAQIVINLVDNALKFSAAAGRKRVELTCRKGQGGTWLFTVRDFGAGIPAGQMRKIFELFYRPENELTRAAPGTGIGLALVRELAAAMGGRVDVRNCDPGAELRVSLPAARA